MMMKIFLSIVGLIVLAASGFYVWRIESRVLCDGDTADEQADGTILIKNKKTCLYDEKGVSLGAAWYDEWINPDGKVVRKTRPASKVLEG